MSVQMRVLQLLDAFSVGGAQRLVIDLVKRIDKQRFAIHIGCLKQGGALVGDYSALGVPLLILNTKHLYDLSVFYQLIHYIREHKIDIIHTHLTDADILGRIAGAFCGVPVLSTLHNIPLGYAQRNFHRRLLQRLTAQLLVRKCIVVSPSIRDMFVTAWGLPPDRIVAIKNAIPVEQYTHIPDLDTAQGRTTVITTIGRLNKAKGHHLLLDAAKRIVSHHSDVEFLIVGDGPLKKELQSYVQQIGITKYVTFAGIQKDIPRILARTDIFVLPSFWEGLPLTVMEAMSAGRPVVLTNVGGNRDLIHSGEEGFLVEAGNIDELVKNIIYLIDHTDQRLSMGRAARIRSLEQFTMDRYITQHEYLYKEIYGS